MIDFWHPLKGKHVFLLSNLFRTNTCVEQLEGLETPFSLLALHSFFPLNRNYRKCLAG